MVYQNYINNMFNLSFFFNYKYVIFKKQKNYLIVYFFKYITLKICIKLLYDNNKFFKKNDNILLRKQIVSCVTVIYRTINFVGKTYKILNKKKIMNMKFNRSHITYIFFNQNFIKKKISKQKYKYKFFCTKNIKKLKNILNTVRKLNIFTLRGIKLSKSIKYKKKGKISTYTM